MEDDKLKEILRHFDHAMLVTRTREGQLRSRPMAIADVNEGADLFFATHIKSGKIDELTRDCDVNVAMQDDRRFLSISGKAMLVDDRRRVHELFSPAWQAWFPGGPDDPNLRLLKVSSEVAEYWDSAGMKGMKFLFEAGKTLLQDEAMDDEEEIVHNTVRLDEE